MISATDLKYFLETARTLHVSRAAERLGITQPALSHCLKRLEDEVGAALFIRTKRGVTLTSSGRKLFEHAEDLHTRWSYLKSAVREDADEISGTVRLGVHISVSQYTLPEFLPELLHSHPKLDVKLTHGLSRHMTEQVVSSQLDVALAVNPVAHPDLIIKEICRDQVTFWRSPDCKNPEILLLEPDLRQTQTLLGQMAREYRRRIESSSLEVLARLLLGGAGTAILPERVLRAMTGEKMLKVKGAPVFEDRICLVYQREFVRLARGRAFVNAVVTAFS